MCEHCDEQLCALCVFDNQSGHTHFTSCVRCELPAKKLKAHRSGVPFGRRVRGAWTYPLRLDGLLSMVAMGLIVGLLRWGFKVAFLPMKPFMLGLWAGSFWSYVMHLIRQVAIGENDFSAPEFRDVTTSIVLPGVRGIVATALIWAPAVIYVWFFRAQGTVGMWKDPLLWLIGIAGVFYGPMAIIMAATGTGLIGILNPVWVFGNAARLGRDYWVAVAWLFPVFVVSVLSYGVAFVVIPRWISFPLVGDLISETITSYTPFVMAYILGSLLYVRGDVLGYGRSEDYYEDLDPTAEPKGQKPAKLLPGEEGPRPVIHAVENPPATDSDGYGHAYTPSAALDLEPEPLDALQSAVAEQRLDDAIKAYGKLTSDELRRVSAELHVAVGQKAASSGDYPLAVNALKAAAANARDPAAPKACIILARIYRERLGDDASAQKLFRHVLSRYPETPAAEFAKKALGS